MLEFNVKGQQLMMCGNVFVAASSVNYLTARFSFSEDWAEELTRTAVFYNAARGEAYNQVLDEDGECVVPWEVISAPYFYVSVYSGASDEETHETTLLITTNELKIGVERSGYRLGDTTNPPTADVYVQLTTLIDQVSDLLDQDTTALGNRLTTVEDAVSAETLARTSADTALSGRLTTAESKLLTVESGAEVNVQADWSENDITSDAFIKNKPSIGVLSSLTTSDKSSIVAAINEVDADLTSETATRANADTSLGNGITAAFTAIGTLSNLNTTAKTNLVAAVNEVDADILAEATTRANADTALSGRITTNASDISAAALAVAANKADIGTLSNLNTTAKSSLVAAVNEVDGRCDVNAGAIGTLSSLTTTAKSSLVAAVNELDAGKADTGDIVTYAISGSGNTVTLTGSDGSTSSATVSGGGGGGGAYTAGAGIDITSDVISVADNGVTAAKLSSTVRGILYSEPSSADDLSDYLLSGIDWYSFSGMAGETVTIYVDAISDGSDDVTDAIYLPAADDYGYDLSARIYTGNYYEFEIVSLPVSGAEPTNGSITVTAAVVPLDERVTALENAVGTADAILTQLLTTGV